MANEVSDTNSADSATAKKQKTGGRVKKSLDQMMAETRIRNEIAGMNDDTNLPEELAAIYLCSSVSELAAYRKPVKMEAAASWDGRAKLGKGANPEAGWSHPRLKMIKPIRQGAVGQNQKVFYLLKHLREFRDLNVVESSFEAAVNAGLYGALADGRRVEQKQATAGQEIEEQSASDARAVKGAPSSRGVAIEKEKLARLEIVDRLHSLPDTAMFTTKMAAAFLGSSVTTMERMRVKGSGPAYAQGGEKGARGVNQKCLYMKSDLLAWHAANKVTSSMKAAIRKGQV